MDVQVHNATLASDIVVDLKSVSKTFRQRQRSDNLREAFGTLLHPRIREVKALQNIDLEIRRGEIVAYAGPNGAGKSTTVKLLSGMLVPDQGTVRVLGMDPIRDRVRYVNRIGVVFGQRSELWWDHPVSASFEWKRVVWNVPRERYSRMVALVQEVLGLQEFFNSLVRELSLGQRMRADLGLALLHEPEILFLDEPTLGMDVLAKRNMLQFITAINREQQVTVMLTSHDMSETRTTGGAGRDDHAGRTGLRWNLAAPAPRVRRPAAAGAGNGKYARAVVRGCRTRPQRGTSARICVRCTARIDRRAAATGCRTGRGCRCGNPPCANRRCDRRHLRNLARPSGRSNGWDGMIHARICAAIPKECLYGTDPR